jgi:predicted  nucleic acid-binding Zn-ribbon protein
MTHPLFRRRTYLEALVRELEISRMNLLDLYAESERFNASVSVMEKRIKRLQAQIQDACDNPDELPVNKGE